MKNNLLCLLLIMVTITPLRAKTTTPIVLANRDLQLTFADASKGFGCLELRNCRDGAVFGPGDDADAPLLWQIKLSSGGRLEGQTVSRYTEGGILVSETLNSDQGLLTVSNLDDCRRSCTRQTIDGIRQLTFHWNDIALPGGAGTLQVSCTFRLPAEHGMATGTLTAELQSDTYAFESSVFPILSGLAAPGDYDLLAPRLTFGAQLFRANRQAFSLTYPSIMAQVEYLALFRPEQGGLYFGLHDPAGSTKTISVGSDAGIAVEAMASDAGRPGHSRLIDYQFAVAPADDAWEAGRRYRQWAVTQPMLSKGKLNQRTDLPANYRDIDLWLNVSGSPAELKAIYDRAKTEVDGILAIHWYNWNEHKFDTNYPFFLPAQPGFEAVTREITANGDFVVPYLNGHLWDSTLPSYATDGTAAAVKNRSGQIHLEDYHSGVALAPMCPASAIYQRALQQQCRQLIAMGVNGIYLDQIGQLMPGQCFDATHGHPLGGGNFWVEGYRELLTPLLEEAPGSIFFATENAAEPYGDVITSCLVWTEITGEDFPALSQAYSGYINYFGALSFADDDLPSFAAAQKRGVLWGLVPGWLSWLHGRKPEDRTPESAAMLAYLNRVIAWRRTLADHVKYGQLLDGVHFSDPVPEIVVKWNRMGGETHSEALLSGTVWLADDGSLAVPLANIGAEARVAKFRFRPERYGLTAGPYRLYSVAPDGRRTLLTSDASTPLEAALPVPAYDFAAVIAEPVEAR
ncbi:DUF6259 domain-containing protein [Victivallis sp. Marseille-Q1083]|uniref:DUF6259 domain-containing protein n=1 Tax=Victivallis sp. Marseille-Q1083 TaxID=2717288 RepID=UPI00158AD29D|nr:DUF6259 domain-containing protein [Victivallis sp. Marseille-Q1083]